MKMRNKMAVLALALLGIAGASELYSTGAYARVCFLVGGCRTRDGKLEKFLNSKGESVVTKGVNINPTVLDQDCESLGFKKCKSPDLSSMKCIKNGEVWTERCMCNEDGEYPYMYGDDMNSGLIMPLCCTASCPNLPPLRGGGASVYAKPYTSFNPGTCNPTPGEECTDSQGTHYKHKICKERFKYVTSQEDLNKLQSWNYPATVIGAPSGTYTGTDPCDEKYGLPDNAVVHRYGSYSCNAKYQYMEKDIPSDAFTIDTTKAYSDHEYCFTVDADEDNNINKYPASYRKCSGKAEAGGFWQATCSDGRYSFKSENWDGLICHLCKPSGTTGGSGSGSGSGDGPQSEEIIVPGNYYKMFYDVSGGYANSATVLDNMSEKWMQLYASKSIYIDPVVNVEMVYTSDNAREALMTIIASGEYEKIRLVTFYPLVENHGESWSILLGVQSTTGDSEFIDYAAAEEGVDADFPITVIANLHTGQNYEEYCRDEDMTKQASVKYMGWLSGLETIEEEREERLDRVNNDPRHEEGFVMARHVDDPYYSVNDPVAKTYDNVYALIREEGMGCNPESFQSAEELGISDDNNGLSFDGLLTLLSGEDTIVTGGDKCLNFVLRKNAQVMLPMAVGDVNNRILYILETKPRARVNNIDWEAENGDYPANFLLWKPKNQGNKNAECMYTSQEYDNFVKDYIHTYPQLNRAWSRYDGSLTWDQIIDVPEAYAEESNILDTYLGGDKGEMISKRQEGDPTEYNIFKANYYQENLNKIMNGKLYLSYPWVEDGIKE